MRCGTVVLCRLSFSTLCRIERLHRKDDKEQSLFGVASFIKYIRLDPCFLCCLRNRALKEVKEYFHRALELFTLVELKLNNFTATSNLSVEGRGIYNKKKLTDFIS